MVSGWLEPFKCGIHLLTYAPFIHFIMSNTYANILPITYQRDTFPTPISAISFDPVSDVLWAGNNSGQVAAYYRTRSRGVVYPVGNEFVSTLMTNEHHVYAMTIEGKGLGAWSKGGANKWHYRSV